MMKVVGTFVAVGATCLDDVERILIGKMDDAFDAGLLEVAETYHQLLTQVRSARGRVLTEGERNEIVRRLEETHLSEDANGEEGEQ